MVVKRQPKKLPSVRRHILRALGIFIIAVSGAALIMVNFSDPNDAIALGEVKLEPTPLPPVADVLDVEAQILPDLFEGDVPEGANPTEILDALGNGPGGVAPDDLAGSQSPQTLSNIQNPRDNRPSITSTGPRTILIDGRPIDGNRRASPLVPAPIPSLSRVTPYGPVPQPGANGLKPVSAYARPFSPTAGRNTVSIIIGGLGIDADLTSRAINELPPEITLSFAAHTNRLQQWVDQARAAGHEVLIELPLESADYNPQEPGADKALRTDISASNNIKNLDYLLSRSQGYFAVTNYNGDKLVKRADVLAPIVTHISDAGIGFIFDGSSQAHALPALAATVNLPYTQAFSLIDTVSQRPAIETEFRRIEAQASSGRTPIGVGFAYAETFEALNDWTQSLEAKNLQLAPASYALLKSR